MKGSIAMTTATPSRSYRPRLHALGALAILSFAAAGALAAEQQNAPVRFNSVFLQQLGSSGIDVDRFSQGNFASPGSYLADLYVNEVWQGRVDVTLKQTGANSVEPCFDQALVERIGIDLSKLSPESTALLDDGKDACLTLPRLVNDATASFDNGEQRLDVSVPQAALNRRARDYVDPKYWDNGVPSALLQYNANLYQNYNDAGPATQGYVGLFAGVNFGPWRFRHTGNLTVGTHTPTTYQAVQTNLRRSIVSLKSQLTIGDAFTDGAIFDSFGFRGVQLASDDRMYPESQRGYAPVIRGIARSNALVQVLQNGNVLYETTVAPGQFEIDDLYATGYGGNLQVVVTEADGTKSTTLVPYAAAPNALRPGVTRYSATVGQYRDALYGSGPLVIQATMQHGFTNFVTGYGGLTYANGYLAAVAGAALNTPLGAFGLDVTHARTSASGQPLQSGQSLRLSYSKLFSPTGTNVSVAAYQYSSGGFLSLSDAMALRNAQTPAFATFGNGHRRHSAQVTLNQTLPQGYGTLYLTGTAQTYWNRAGLDTQFQAGYNNMFKNISYGVSFSRQFTLTTGKWDNRVMITASVPLGKGSHAPIASTTLQRDSNGVTGAQTTLAGTLGASNALSYGVNAGYSGGAQAGGMLNGGGNVTYRSPMATVSANASVGKGYRQLGAGLSGSVVAYGGGVAFSPNTGDTMAIVEADGAHGARIASQTGLHVDPWGHALLTGLTPFARNDIEIDPKGLPLSVQLKTSSQRVAPTAGAIVIAKFETDNAGTSAIIRGRTADGEPLPFGADVLDSAGKIVGTVAQGGRAIVRGLPLGAGELRVQWEENAHSQECRLPYALPDTAQAAPDTWTAIDSTCKLDG